MYLFACDLDNTIIHSYKTASVSDICVELKDEKKLSFMTSYAYNELRRINKIVNILFVPITTRSTEQYNRIDFFDGIPSKLALTANGGVLLKNGVSDMEWLSASKELIRDSINDFKTGIEYLSNDKDVYFDVRIVDELFVFTKSHKPEETKKELEKLLDLKIVSVYNIGEKVYIFPNVLSKGMAVLRLDEYYGFEKKICAGDSEFDISMLDIADMAYCPDSLRKYVSNENCTGFDVTEKRFADWLLSEFERSGFNEMYKHFANK